MANPPFNWRPWEIGRLTTDQLLDLFCGEWERGEGWAPTLPDPREDAAKGLPPVTPRGVYLGFLWSIGIDDPGERERLWDAERRRRAERKRVAAERRQRAKAGRRSGVIRPPRPGGESGGGGPRQP